MGAWGYGPFDNDNAGEFVSIDVVRPLLKTVEQVSRKKKGYHYKTEQAIAAIEILLHVSKISNGVFEHELEECSDALDIISSDDNYMMAWNDPEKAFKQINAQKKRVKDEIYRQRHSRGR